MLHCVLGAAKAQKKLWSFNPTFPALPNDGTHTVWTPDQFLWHPGAKEAHNHRFGLFLPLWVTFKSDFLSSLSLWITRYSERRLEGEVIKRNSAHLFSFLSLRDNLFICYHLSRGRQNYFPMDRANPKCPRAPVPRIHIAKYPWSFGVNRDNFSIHRCKRVKCQCLLTDTSSAFQAVSVAMGTQGTFITTSPSIEVCSFTGIQFPSTYILQFDPSVDKLWFVMRTENIF